MEIITARKPDQLETIRSLFREYEDYLQVDLCFQGFEAELAGLPGDYTPPGGALLLAMAGNQAAGCVALRPFDKNTGEMKRLFVRPGFLRQGIGGQLARAVIARARAAGYGRMVLDTLDKLKPALALYHQLGFRPRAPYYDNPLPGVVYLELNLKEHQNGGHS